MVPPDGVRSSLLAWGDFSLAGGWGPAVLVRTGALEVHSVPLALLLAAGVLEDWSSVPGVLLEFLRMDFWGALPRLRKALVLAESKKLSGTPAFFATDFFWFILSSSFLFFSISRRASSLALSLYFLFL